MAVQTETTGERIIATCELHAGEGSPDALADAEALAGAIALEQTVEVPRALADAANLPADTVRRVERVEGINSSGAGAARAVLSHDATIVEAGGDASAPEPRVRQRLHDSRGTACRSRPPRARARSLRGPVHGVAGLRALTGVYGRPLLATALKLRRVPVARLVEMAGTPSPAAATIPSRTIRTLSTSSKRSSIEWSGVRPRAVSGPAGRVRRAACTPRRPHLPLHYRVRDGPFARPRS